jgi:hypothetical protein
VFGISVTKGVAVASHFGIAAAWAGIFDRAVAMIQINDFGLAEFLFALSASLFGYQLISIPLGRQRLWLKVLLGIAACAIYGYFFIDVLAIKGSKPWTNISLTTGTPSPSIKISQIEPMPLEIGVQPMVKLHLEAASTARAGIQWGAWTVRGDTAEDVQERKKLEDTLWSEFLRGSKKPELLGIPVGPGVWIEMKGKDPVKDEDLKQVPPSVRDYFLARFLNQDGTAIVESCFFFFVRVPSYITYCVHHNQ